MRYLQFPMKVGLRFNGTLYVDAFCGWLKKTGSLTIIFSRDERWNTNLEPLKMDSKVIVDSRRHNLEMLKLNKPRRIKAYKAQKNRDEERE